MAGIRREWVKEIAAAHRAGDLDTLLAIAIELAGIEAHFAARLESDAVRKRRSRKGRTSEDVTGRDVTGRDITAPAPFSPGPPFSSPTPTTATAREALDEKAIAAKAELIQALGGGTTVAALVERYAAAIPEVRRYPWVTAMVSWLDTQQSEHYSAGVMMSAMTDWLMADRVHWPWEGRKFRSFMRDIERQRTPRNLEVVKGNGRTRRSGAPQRFTYDEPTDSEAKVKWQTP